MSKRRRAMPHSKARRHRKKGEPRGVLVNVYDQVLTVPEHEAFLRSPSEIVVRFDSKIKTLCDEMLWITRHDPNALGLAAPQLGKALRIFTLRISGKVHCIVNPMLASASGAASTHEYEGCFSIPNKRARVRRHTKVFLSGLDEKGGKVQYGLSGKEAIAAQHEIDHLDGVLIDRLGDLEDVRGDVIATDEKLPDDPEQAADRVQAILRGET